MPTPPPGYLPPTAYRLEPVPLKTPGAVIVARVLAWIQTGFGLGLAVWGLGVLVLFGNEHGGGEFADLGRVLGLMMFLMGLSSAALFGVPLLFLRRARSGGRIALIIIESIVAAGGLSSALNADQPITAVVAVLWPGAIIAALCTPAAVRWSREP